MKPFNILQTKVSSKVRTIFAALTAFLEIQSAYAQEKTNSVDILVSMQYGLSMLVPIACAIILLFLLILWVFRIIARATFARWAFSVIIAGAAFYISSILFHIS
ncbi:glucan phosphoethanolaminetransferase (alkaline phosphatase superfamily) [Bartonella callosciuri]|uniref:Glucan phosphoethanolaminetransferase (Alkaline phosphatase superfamily) n=1 Tax=Bartonella callosciuri TaxID=686223 RepID=A0A840NY30_9HYPH|nr:conjugal transfer protein [Bartonella callosciuri]MBB5074252.1 glucan phosphoethanolaminetransferase (alkaline phosphatase superfamily) [Bartonella callosciuri]